MGKRKRDSKEEGHIYSATSKKTDLTPSGPYLTQVQPIESKSVTIQIVIGSYDKILHGITATVSFPTGKSDEIVPEVEFADTFLFNAHTSAIRCLAISPLPLLEDAIKSPKLILASGSTDERINLYHISALATSAQVFKALPLPSLGSTRVQENPRNRELGSLLHHSSSITALYFPTRSKLLSAAEDNTIAISRTRDWTVLSSIKAPIPKAIGRPSGDTAPLGGTPAGVNDFAVHPSMKLMISVGKGERCMRLWNLVTGRKAGVLTFERDILVGIGEGKWASGEGRKVEWNGNGDEYVVGFERGAVVFGMDSKPKCRIMPSPPTKIHQIRYVFPAVDDGKVSDLLAVSTEDGRIIFYSTKTVTTVRNNEPQSKADITLCVAIGQLGGKPLGLTVRVKDFEFLPPTVESRVANRNFVVAGSSDGSIRVWTVTRTELERRSIHINGSSEDNSNGKEINGNSSGEDFTHQVGSLIGTFESGNRITCLKAFIMLNPGMSSEADANKSLADEFDGIDSSATNDNSNEIV